MKRGFALLLLLAVMPLAGSLDGTTAEAERYWGQWRGPLMTGEAPQGSPPVEWSERKNIRWKVPIPGSGASTPIVWGDTIYLQTALPFGEDLPTRQNLNLWQKTGEPVFRDRAYVNATQKQRFMLLALDRATGELRWGKVLHEELPHEGVHPTNTWASASPATDGRTLVAFFGSRGLFALDLDGTLLWEKDLGDMDTRNGWGEGASPLLYKGRVVVPWDHEGDSFLAVFDARSGKELWRRSRDERTAWFTPLVIEAGGREHVITGGKNRVEGYDFETGKTLWTGPGLTLNFIPSPVYDSGLLYLMGGFRGNELLAIDLAKARGDLEQAGAIVWRLKRDTPYVPSPLLYRGTLYFTKGLRPILSARDARTGEAIFGPLRVSDLGGLYASPVAADGRIYLAGQDGNVVVFRHGPEFDVLATNKLDDGFDASPAVVDNEIYLRGRKFLYRISED